LIGRSDEVAAEALASPEKFALLFSGITNEDPLTRLRAADAVEKITAIHPEWLQPYRETILGEIANIPRQEARWHVCQLFPDWNWTGDRAFQPLRFWPVIYPIRAATCALLPFRRWRTWPGSIRI